jgi:3-hydroxyisobutyrate dehydrogenase-like beta-hydroxyacid dehydrogenase
MRETIAVLGTGKMGTSLARAFSAAGHRVVVWNRTPAGAEPLKDVATVVRTPADAANEASLLVSSLADYDVCGDVLFTPEMGKLLKGKTVAVLTSGTPSNARSAATWASRHGVQYLDGAILAYPSFIATEYAMVFYAGSRAAFDMHERALQALAKNTVFVAEAIGAAAALDCAILETYYGGCLAFLHAAAICESEGIPTSRFFKYKASFLGLIDVTADAAGPMLERHEYSGDQCSLDTHVAALAHIVSLSREAGLDGTLPNALHQQYAAAAAAGLGSLELPAVYELLGKKRSSAEGVIARAAIHPNL